VAELDEFNQNDASKLRDKVIRQVAFPVDAELSVTSVVEFARSGRSTQKMLIAQRDHGRHLLALDEAEITTENPEL